MTEAVVQAREAGLGVWQGDRTTDGIHVQSLRSITEEQVILPKLFRRLAAFIADAGEMLAEFPRYLARRAEDVLVVSSAHLTHFDNLVQVDGSQLRLTQPPENLVFLPANSSSTLSDGL